MQLEGSVLCFICCRVLCRVCVCDANSIVYRNIIACVNVLVAVCVITKLHKFCFDILDICELRPTADDERKYG